MDENKNSLPPKESIGEVLRKYKEAESNGQIKTNYAPEQPNTVTTHDLPKMQMPIAIPKISFNPQDFEKTMSKETDPDLMTSYEVVKLPSKGMFYPSRVLEVNVEYMTSKDEDLLTTPSLIDNGTVLDVLLRRKIKTHGINVEELLAGDRNAIILFLRTSSYGADYTVQVSDPRSGIPFTTKVDLLKLEYKEPKEMPDELGHFQVELPMRKKTVTFRLLSVGEDTKIFNKAEQIKEAYNEEFSQYNTLKLKAAIIAINEKTDRSYIDRFVDAMPALDAFTIRRKIIDVSPDVDMAYEFMAKDGYKFKANLTVGIDFFFPRT
jgi:hypothetical protein